MHDVVHAITEEGYKMEIPNTASEVFKKIIQVQRDMNQINHSVVLDYKSR